MAGQNFRLALEVFMVINLPLIYFSRNTKPTILKRDVTY